MKYTYFIAYNFFGTKNGSGWTTVDANKKIEYKEEIEKTVENIKNAFPELKNATIIPTNFILLKEEQA